MAGILLVEDEFLVLESAGEILRSLGHLVWPASSGAEALRALDKEGEGIDIVILDLSLPDIDGRRLLERVIEERPNLKVVISSGSRPDDNEFAGTDNVRAFLGKPYSTRELKEVVAELAGAEAQRPAS